MRREDDEEEEEEEKNRGGDVAKREGEAKEEEEDGESGELPASRKLKVQEGGTTHKEERKEIRRNERAGRAEKSSWNTREEKE